MKLYKCNLTLYVLAESEQDAQRIARENAQREYWANWEVEQETKYVSGLWGISLPYVKDESSCEELTCNKFLEKEHKMVLRACELLEKD